MRERLVLWDVDHTLLNAGGWSSQLYGLVFAELFGRSLPRVAPMAGRTDRAIIVETLTMAGVPDPREHVPAFIEAMTRQAPAYGEQVRTRGRVLPGVPEALAALALLGAEPGGAGRSGRAGSSGWAGRTGRSGRVRQSVLTGNIRPLAEVKLAALGLGDPLDLAIGAYGDMDEVRAELVGVARARAGGSGGDFGGDSAEDTGRDFGRDFGGEATVLVGDTPLDVAAALATGARAVAVATGSYTEAELAASGAHAVLPDLSDTGRVLAAILGGRA